MSEPSGSSVQRNDGARIPGSLKKIKSFNKIIWIVQLALRVHYLHNVPKWSCNASKFFTVTERERRKWKKINVRECCWNFYCRWRKTTTTSTRKGKLGNKTKLCVHRQQIIWDVNEMRNVNKLWMSLTASRLQINNPEDNERENLLNLPPQHIHP